LYPGDRASLNALLIHYFVLFSKSLSQLSFLIP
jgi:hypothetical protein